MSLADTSAAASEVYYRRLAEMTPAERIAIGVALWEAGDATQRSTMRRMYPEADEDEITFPVAVTRFGAELARSRTGGSSS